MPACAPAPSLVAPLSGADGGKRGTRGGAHLFFCPPQTGTISRTWSLLFSCREEVEKKEKKRENGEDEEEDLFGA